jgi:two-component system, OmpR family, sensor histidine kinase TctE
MNRQWLPWTRPSLRLRLFVMVTTPVLVLLLLSGTFIYRTVLTYDRTEHDRALITNARSVVALLLTATAIGKLSPEVRYLLSYDTEGSTYFIVESSRQGTLSSTDVYPHPPRLPGAGKEPLLFDSVVDAQPVRGVVLQFRPPGEPDDLITVTIAESLHSRLRLAREILLLTLLTQGLLIGILLALVWAGVNVGLRSLQPLMRKLQSREQGLEPVTDHDVPREILPLTRTIDALFGRLREAIDVQEHFIADAAHQLRTPLAGLQLHVERALASTTVEDAHAALSHIAALTARAGRTSTQLLSLMRAQAPLDAADELARIDLAAFAVETVTQRAPDGLRAGVDLGYEGSASGVVVTANPALLRDLIDNLIDNALLYAGQGHAVTVSARQLPPDTAELAVEDDGPGVPGPHLNRLGERFFRVPGGASAGTGLGLAIVRRIADRHGATVHFRRGVRDGLLVSIQFPVPITPPG